MTPLILWAAAAVAADGDDFRGYVDQARFFLKKEWHADARDQLEQAVRTEDGRLDPEAWFLLARVRYELADAPGARHAADRAHVNARSEDQAEQAAALRSWLDTQFGYLDLASDSSRTSIRLDLRAETLILDPQLKVYLQRLKEVLAEPITLPRTLGLPVGTYTLNGETVTVDAGSHAAHVARSRSGLGAMELEVGGGLMAWFGPRHLLPAPSAGLAVSVPLGPTVVGVMGDWSLQPYQTRDGTLFVSPAGWSVGGRIGAEVPNTAPLVLRGSLGARVTRMAATELACASDGDAWRCGPDLDPRQLYVYPAATGWGPLVEVAALVVDRGRRGGFGGGIKVSGEYVLGRLPAGGTSHTVRGDGYAWGSEPGRWSAFGVRALADLSYAF